jgi:hypothetical protein
MRIYFWNKTILYCFIVGLFNCCGPMNEEAKEPAVVSHGENTIITESIDKEDFRDTKVETTSVYKADGNQDFINLEHQRTQSHHKNTQSVPNRLPSRRPSSINTGSTVNEVSNTPTRVNNAIIRRFGYTMKLFVNREKGNNKILQIKGKDTYAINLQVLLRIILEEQQFREQSTQASDTIIKTKEFDRKFDQIRASLHSDGSIKFIGNDGKLANSFEHTEDLPEFVSTTDREVFNMFAKFVINPEVQNSKRRTVITAVLYMDKTGRKTQIEKLELEIIPLSFWEKIMQFYYNSQDETINIMNVLYTALLGILAKYITTFIRKKLNVKEEDDPKKSE